MVQGVILLDEQKNEGRRRVRQVDGQIGRQIGSLTETETHREKEMSRRTKR